MLFTLQNVLDNCQLSRGYAVTNQLIANSSFCMQLYVESEPLVFLEVVGRCPYLLSDWPKQQNLSYIDHPSDDRSGMVFTESN